MDELLWEFHQQRHIQSASADASDALRKAAGAAERILQLEADVDRLLLLNRALWETIRSLHGLDDVHLEEKVREIDLRDGLRDGKLTRTEAHRCARCRRPLSRRHLRCMYCGSDHFCDDPFDAVR